MAIKISKNRVDMGSTPIKNVSYLDVDQVATQAAPATGKTRFYSKTDGGLYIVPAGGSETSLNSAAHIAASAAVHGLPASVNVLGNRNAAGQFVQHGSGTGGTGANAVTFATSNDSPQITFPVAFSTTPKVFTTNDGQGSPSYYMSPHSISTTGFSGRTMGASGYVGDRAIVYLAIGS